MHSIYFRILETCTLAKNLYRDFRYTAKHDVEHDLCVRQQRFPEIVRFGELKNERISKSKTVLTRNKQDKQNKNKSRQLREIQDRLENENKHVNGEEQKKKDLRTRNKQVNGSRTRSHSAVNDGAEPIKTQITSICMTSSTRVYHE